MSRFNHSAIKHTVGLLNLAEELDNISKACRKRLFSLRWPEWFRCPHCGCRYAYPLEKRLPYQCAACKLQTSLTADTIMHRTRTPLVKWFWAIYLVSTDKRGLSALTSSRKIGQASSAPGRCFIRFERQWKPASTGGARISSA